MTHSGPMRFDSKIFFFSENIRKEDALCPGAAAGCLFYFLGERLTEN